MLPLKVVKLQTTAILDPFTPFTFFFYFNCRKPAVGRSNKCNLCYYLQINSLWLKSSLASKWAGKSFGGNIYFAGDSTRALPQ